MSLEFIKSMDKKIHFIGIGGISMSGIAEILLEKNYNVSGSDINSSNITNILQNKGAEIYIGHKSENIDSNTGLVIYTAAISKDNPEILRASELNIPLMDRAEFLGNLMKDHKYNIAISGTHGKTTTTSMVSHIIIKAELDPTILVGGELDIIEGNVKTGNSEYFITEACEYKGSFLKFFPYIGVILNIDEDHLDYYKDITEIQKAFVDFAKMIPNDGYLIACAEDDKMDKVLQSVDCNIITYGLNTGCIQATDITYNGSGCASFKVLRDNNYLFTVDLNVPGEHNVLNALASIGISLALNISYDHITEGLKSFHGTHRRFELKGTKNGVTVVDDYAHHPTEIKATLRASKNYPHNRIVCVFQPHTYTRTYTLLKEFSECFDGADKIVLADIYAAREKDEGLVSSVILGDRMREKGLSCVNFHSFEDIVKHLKENLLPGDLLLTVGAGDVFKIGEMFLKE
ncbi:UDP-N-acetylmuramate--L-alanine ligase [uncultured Clostridium sp.]|uniref:UDP-N-acetylmuramate--L-alanine ligase n=1 Tax=uncultured Clostridium sp. TaxID=59620 RepID=UPI0028E24FA8|nr:UDP-N-acetylmuramate--L-alanine ligase [uncultured Clostridium sp.]